VVGALAPSSPSPREVAEGLLGHRFARPALLDEALTHRSAIYGRTGRKRGERRGVGSNERLEFVGDRVLGLLVAEWLIERFPNEQEGELGLRLAHLVSRVTIGAIAERAGLSAALAVAPGEARAGVTSQTTVLADAVEALLGALYLDAGLEPARRFVRAAWAEDLERHHLPPKDPKMQLQEWLMGRGHPLPEYRVVSCEGPPHAPQFRINAEALGLAGEGEGTSKRLAERAAAAALLAKLGA
jgi:ribonuclease-3